MPEIIVNRRDTGRDKTGIDPFYQRGERSEGYIRDIDSDRSAAFAIEKRRATAAIVCIAALVLPGLSGWRLIVRALVKSAAGHCGKQYQVNSQDILQQLHPCKAIDSNERITGSREIYYRNNSSHGFRPVCFLKAVEKWEIEE